MISRIEVACGLVFVDPQAENPTGLYAAMDHDPPNTHAAIFRAGHVAVERLSWKKKQMLVLIWQVNYVRSALQMWQLHHFSLQEGNKNFDRFHEIHVKVYRITEYLECYLADKPIIVDPCADWLPPLHPIDLQRSAIAVLKEFDRFALVFRSYFQSHADEVSCVLAETRLALNPK